MQGLHSAHDASLHKIHLYICLSKHVSPLVTKFPLNTRFNNVRGVYKIVSKYMLEKQNKAFGIVETKIR